MTYDINLTTRAESLNGKLDELLDLALRLRRIGQTGAFDEVPDTAIETHRLWVDITEAVADLREETR